LGFFRVESGYRFCAYVLRGLWAGAYKYRAVFVLLEVCNAGFTPSETGVVYGVLRGFINGEFWILAGVRVGEVIGSGLLSADILGFSTRERQATASFSTYGTVSFLITSCPEVLRFAHEVRFCGTLLTKTSAEGLI